MIKTSQEKTKSLRVKPLAQSKMAAMPVGVDAVFLADEIKTIVDVTSGSEEAVEQASHEYQRLSKS